MILNNNITNFNIQIKIFLEAEEKMNKMKDDYVSTKEKESQMVEEIERLKKKLNAQEALKSQSTFTYSKQNKGIYHSTKIMKLND